MSSPSGSHLLLEVRVSGRPAHFETRAVRATALLPELDRAPGMPPALEGFWLLHDVAIPVLGLARLLGAEVPAWTPETALVRIALPSGDVAFLVDQVLGVSAHPAENLRPVSPETTWNAACRALLAAQGGAEPVLDPARLLTAAEEERLRAFCERSAHREREFVPPAA